ncbi:MAG: alpha/beta hydrolase [Acidimicrobiales bacterium]|nr:alpha/beta hydrolase [Acidimicrobiales bacterium]
MAAVSANGITIEYEERGSGPPLLLVMGLGGQLTDWPGGFIDLLASHYRVIVFDNRDIGLSTEFTAPPATRGQLVKAFVARRPPPAEYLISDMAADAAGLLTALGIEAAHVVGMSMGGMIAQAMAIDHPAKVRSLTSIMSKPGDPRSGGIAPKLMVRLARRPNATRETAVDDAIALFRVIGGSSYDEAEHRARQEISLARSFRPHGQLRQTVAIAASPDRTPGLERLELPTLVVHGLQDPLVVPSGGIATAKAVRGSRLLMFPDMGHDLPKTRWPEITEAIQAVADRSAVPL